MARPSVLTDDVRAKILDALRKGNFRATAAAAAGVSRTNFFVWEKRAEAGDEPYAAFVDEMRAAEAEAEMVLVDRIRSAQPGVPGVSGADPWQTAAWMLERRFASRWCARVKQHQIETEETILRKLKAKPELHAEVAHVLATDEDPATGAGTAH